MVSPKSIRPRVGILTGTTGSGKTSLAIEWCHILRTEYKKKINIINADSLLFYKDFNIGTAKPSESEKKDVPHFFIDHIHPEEPYSSGEFFKDACLKINSLHQKNEDVLLVGGSGFYIKPFLYGTWSAPKAPQDLREELEKKESHELWSNLLKHYPTENKPRFNPQDRYRIIRSLEIISTTGQTPENLEKEHRLKNDPPFDAQLWFIDWPKETLQSRIYERTQKMLDLGWIDEVKKLRQQYPKARALQSVGYREIIHYLDGVQPQGRKLKTGREGLIDEIFIANNQLIKKQRTWTRSEKLSQHFLLEKDLKQLKEKVFNFFISKKKSA